MRVRFSPWFLPLVFACRSPDVTNAADVTSTRPVADAAVAVVADTSPPPAPAPTPPPDPATVAAHCTGTGDFDLGQLVSDPVCAAANDDLRIQRTAMGTFKNTGSFDYDLRPATIHAKGGDAISFDVTVTSKNKETTEVFFLVRTVEWFIASVRPSGSVVLDAADRLKGAPAPGLKSPDPTSPFAWWTAIRFAPRAVGHTKAAAITTTERVEHLESQGGAPAPYMRLDVPLAPGTYALQAMDPLTNATFSGHPAATLVIDR